jgi:hypothetical protein
MILGTSYAVALPTMQYLTIQNYTAHFIVVRISPVSGLSTMDVVAEPGSTLTINASFGISSVLFTDTYPPGLQSASFTSFPLVVERSPLALPFISEHPFTSSGGFILLSASSAPIDIRHSTASVLRNKNKD